MSTIIKRTLLAIGAFAALALGGAQLVGAQTSSTSTPTATTAPEQTSGADAEQPGTDANEPKEANEPSDTVAGADADKIKAAALAEVPGGKVTDVSAETPEAADPGEKDEKPDAGEKPDSPAKANAAYEAEVTKADGSKVEVFLDKQFKVTGSQVEQPDNEQDNETAGE